MASQFTLLGTHIQGVLNGIIDAVNGKAPSSHNHDDRYWHSGNDGSGSGLDADLLDGIESSRFVYGNSGNRIGTNLISNWNQTDYPDVAFLSAENGGTNAPSSDYSYGMQYSFHRSGAGYRTQFVTSLYSDLDIWVRNSRDSDVWTSWKKLIHSGNVGSQSVNYANSAGSANTSLTVTGKSSISYEAHVAGANDYNLELYSDDTGDGSRYVSLRFHQGSRYWGQIRYNSAGFRLTGGADDSLNNLYAGVYYATGGNSTNWNTAYGWGNNYISDVRLSESNLEFTGEGSAFTGTIDLSGLPFQPAGSYLTAEADTLATVTARGSSTTSSITVNGSLLALNNGATYAYTTASNGRLYLGSSAQNDYSIYTHMENFGGNYSKLTLDWHTGIKIGASQGYGGIRFYSDAINNGGVKLFSVGEGDSHVRVENNLYVGGNLAIHAGNIGSQSVSYASSAGNADTLDGYHSNTVGNRHHTARGFTVGGDQNTYYPVTFGGSGAYAFNRYSIYRYYQWTAPWDPLGTGYHRGGLTFDFEWSGDIAWGGNDHTLRVIQLSEQYTSQVGGLALPVTQGVCVWLRGGTSYYEIQVDAYPVDVVVHLEGFTAGNGAFYGPREDNSNIQSEIYNRMPVRGSSELYDGGSRVITAGNIASQSVSYAVTSGTSSATTQTDFSELSVGGEGVATREYVTSQGYLTSLPSHTHDDRYYTESESDGRFFFAQSSQLANTNLNDLTTRGVYYSADNYGTNTNIPFANYFTMINLTNDAGRQAQLWFGDTPGSAYWRPRQGDSTTWHAWENLITSNNIGSQSVSYATSAGNATTANGANGNFYIDDNYGNSIVGLYASTRYQGVFAMGDSYKLPADGASTGSLYGLAWSHPNAGGVAGNLNTHGLLVMENGTFLAAISGSIRARDDMRAPIFYDSANTSYYLDPNSSTSGYFAGTLRQNDGKYVRDSNYRTISGYSDYYSGGSAGWYRVAEITLTGNCSGAVLFGTLYDHRYDGADAYQISVVARAECDFTSNNESHYINVGCTILGSTNYSNYQSKIRVLLVASSSSSRTYEVQFYESPWNHDTWQLETTSGWTVYSSPQAPRSSTGTAKVNYISNQNADYQRANVATYSPIYYDSLDTNYYVDPNSNSKLVNLGLGGVTPDARLSVSGDIHMDGYIYQGGTAGTVNSWGSRTFVSSGSYVSNAASFAFNNVGYGSNWTFAIASDGAVTTNRHIDANTVWTNDATTLFLGWYGGKVVIGNNNEDNHDAAAGLGGNTIAITNTLYSFEQSNLYYDGSLKLYMGSDGTRNTGWAYHNDNSTGLHWPNNGWHFYPKDVNDMYMRSGSSTNVAIAMSAAGTTRGYVYAENDNTIGFLNNSRSWSFRSYANGNATVYGYLTVNGAGTSSSIYMNDSDEGQREIHCNSNRIGFLTQAGAWGAWLYDSADWEAAGSVRAPIFYDSNDTNYYLNPAGGSRLRNLYVGDSGDDWSDPGGWGTQVRFSNGPHVKFVLHARTPGIEAGMYVHTPGSVFMGSYTGHSVNMMVGGNSRLLIEDARVYSHVYMEAAGSMRAPIFYDSNDTNYYLDPAGTSKLGGLMLEANLETGRASYGADKANLVLLASSTYGRAAIDFRSGVNYPSDGAQIYYETATNLSSGETSRLVIRTENDADDSILIRGGFIELNTTTVDGGSSSPGVRTQYNGNNRLLTYSDHTAETSSFNAPQFLVNNHSDNTRGYRIHNTSGSSVSAMFTNSSNALVIGAGAFDQVNLNKKVFVNGVALGVNVAPSATAGRIDASNDIVAYSSSDERLKHNIAPIENALDKVKSLTGVEFDWKPEYKQAHGYEGHDTGIIAQQVQDVMPSAVRTNETGFLAVRYEKLIGLLVEANKELAARVEELEKKLG